GARHRPPDHGARAAAHGAPGRGAGMTQELVGRIVEVLRLQLLLQLILAVLLGGVVGLEREISGKPAGLRTNILICVGAALFTTLSFTVSLGRGRPARVPVQTLPVGRLRRT